MPALGQQLTRYKPTSDTILTLTDRTGVNRYATDFGHIPSHFASPTYMHYGCHSFNLTKDQNMKDHTTCLVSCLAVYLITYWW